MANYVYIAASLDGYIATESGGIEWLHDVPNPEKSDFGYAEFMAGIDAMVMGRKTFDTVSAFEEWPYEKMVFVLSNSLSEVRKSLIDKVEFLKGAPGEVVDHLNKRGFKNLYIDGGNVIQQFIGEDLVDEMIITRIPILLGKGIKLFGTLPEPLKFRHTKTEVFGNALVKSRYQRVSNTKS